MFFFYWERERERTQRTHTHMYVQEVELFFFFAISYKHLPSKILLPLFILSYSPLVSPTLNTILKIYDLIFKFLTRNFFRGKNKSNVKLNRWMTPERKWKLEQKKGKIFLRVRVRVREHVTFMCIRLTPVYTQHKSQPTKSW